MELEAEYERGKITASGEDSAYTVEARYAYTSPVEIAGQLFDNRWRQVVLYEGAIGVPCEMLAKHRERFGMLGYAQAQALRWWLHAEADSFMNGLCLETRLIKHEIKYSSEAVAVSQHCVIGGEDRSNCVPDWQQRPASSSPNP
jgi:hypothetical protein